MDLYPIKFSPIIKKTIWGGDKISKFKSLDLGSNVGESWEISSVEGHISLVANGSLKGKSLHEILSLFSEQLVGRKCYNLFGNHFPLLIKFIDAEQDLSIQVHPDDCFAKKQGMERGKTELWYIVSCDQGSEVGLGFNQPMTKEQFQTIVDNNAVLQTLRTVRVKPGDVFYVPSGRMHSIQKGCFLVEIQQSSDTTYRLYDYDRRDAFGNKRELHAELAIEAIHYDSMEPSEINYKTIEDGACELLSCDYFSTTILELKNGFEKDYSQIDSFVVLVCVQGECAIKDDQDHWISIHHGETILIPAKTTGLTFVPKTKTTLLEICLK